MMILLRFAWIGLYRHWARTCATIIGIGCVLSMIIFAFGVSGMLVERATESLSSIIQDADIWIVRSPDLQLNPSSGALMFTNALDATFLARAQTIQSTKIATSSNWILIWTPSPTRWIANFEKVEKIAVSDTPHLHTSSTTPIAYLTKTTLSRFSPFSFATKYASLLLHDSLLLTFGLIAHFLFVIGLALGVVASLFCLQEQRDIVSIFKTYDLRGDLSILFLIQTSITLAFALIFAVVLGTLLLILFSPGNFVNALGLGITLGALYATILILLSSLIASYAI